MLVDGCREVVGGSWKGVVCKANIGWGLWFKSCALEGGWVVIFIMVRVE